MQPNSSVEDLAGGLGTLITYLTKSAEGDRSGCRKSRKTSPSRIRAPFTVERASSPSAAHGPATGPQSSMAAAGRAVDAPARHGFVERHEDPGDRRAGRIDAAPAAPEPVARPFAARRGDPRRFAAPPTEEERTGPANGPAPIPARPEIRALTIGRLC